MGWFSTVKNPKIKSVKKTANNTPTGLWKKCPSCSEILQAEKVEDNFQVCPYCQHHFRLSASDRVKLLVDENSFEEIGKGLISSDPLNFTDKMPYAARIQKAQDQSGIEEGAVAGKGTIDGRPFSMAMMDFNYMGGSMGVAVGEKISLAMDLALKEKIPCVVISCSGGARMQEGILSLMQMAKTSGVRQKLKENGIPYISVLTDPTTGGCAASFAMLGDINIAEPKALIGFAGPRVIEQSIRQTLPEGFQRAEFLLEHGFIDRIVHRHELKNELSHYLKFFSK